MKSKIIRIVKTTESTRRYGVYAVVSRYDGELIGKILWYHRWRHYGFFPEEESVFNPTCLREISSYIDDLMEKRKLMRKKK